MERLALFIDDYTSENFQVLIERLTNDATKFRQWQGGQHQASTITTPKNIFDSSVANTLHFGRIRKIQIYRWSQPQQQQERNNIDDGDNDDDNYSTLVAAHWNPRGRTDQNMRELYHGLANGIPQLEDISFRNYTKEDLSICAESYFNHSNVSSMQRCNSYNAITICDNDSNCKFQNSSETREPLCNLQQQPSMMPTLAPLSNLQSVFVSLARAEIMDNNFLEALAKMPNLNNASFWMEEFIGNSCFSVLLKSKTLKILNIQRDHIMRGGIFTIRGWNSRTPNEVDVEKQVISLCQALKQTNTTLRSLDIEHSMCKDGLFLLADMLTANTTLRSLTVSFYSQVDGTISSNGGDNDTSISTCEEVIAAFCDALKINKSLLHLQNRKANQVRVSENIQHSILSLLEDHNYNLRVLDLCSEIESSRNDNNDIQHFVAQKTLFLKLNFWGREQFLKCASKIAWIDLMHQVRDDLDCIYYFVSKNPSLLPESTNSWFANEKIASTSFSTSMAGDQLSVQADNDDTESKQPTAKRKRYS